MIKAEHCHTPEAIADRINAGPQAQYLKEWVYGGIDGVVTTFAIVAAVIGAELSATIVLIMGLANLVGDGFSMAASAFSATKAENDKYERLRQIEESHIEKYPDGEMEETRQIFAAKGFNGEDLDSVVEAVVKDKDVWIDFMMAEEYGVAKPIYTPFKAGANTFWAFLICGAMPLIPYVIPVGAQAWISLVLAGITFFVIGSIKSLWSIKRWYWEGLETLAIGMTAAGLAFAIGHGLKVLAL